MKYYILKIHTQADRQTDTPTHTDILTSVAKRGA